MLIAMAAAQFLAASSVELASTTGTLLPALSCESLSRIELYAEVGANTRITAAEVSGSGPSAQCRIQGIISPAIHFEVRLPVSNWTGRLVQTGCGGLCGTLAIRLENAQSCLPAQRAEIALASTDMGHVAKATDAAWAQNNRAAVIDFAYRATHLTAVAAKALIKHYYGRAPAHSYFVGCSDGGREALMEAQRFPQDFDGISAGAPAVAFTVQASFFHAWNARVNTDNTGRAILTAEKLPLVHAAVLTQCDAADGLQDGIISDPLNCHPDLATLQCKSGQDSERCLTPEQLHLVREIYAGAHDAQGHKLVIGGPLPGSELGWAGVYVPTHPQDRSWSWEISAGAIRYLLSEPNRSDEQNLTDLHFDSSEFARLTRLHGLYDATDPDLTAFADHGGKLLLWHGLADPHISPLYSIAYYEALERFVGPQRAQAFARLFLFPGGAHCGGGEGPMAVDLLSPLIDWVESGNAPDLLIAAHKNSASTLDRSRPVYPYPAVARYTGQGSIDEAANFQPYLLPRHSPWAPSWEGRDFYTPGYELWCDAVNGALECRRSHASRSSQRAPRDERNPT